MKVNVCCAPLVKKQVFVNKILHSRGLRRFPFRKTINQHVKIVEGFLNRECRLIAARTVVKAYVQHCVATRRTSKTVLIPCFIVCAFRLCCVHGPKCQLRTAHTLCIRCQQHPHRRPCCSSRVEFERNASRKTPLFVGCVPYSCRSECCPTWLSLSTRSVILVRVEPFLVREPQRTHDSTTPLRIKPTLTHTPMCPNPRRRSVRLIVHISFFALEA